MIRTVQQELYQMLLDAAATGTDTIISVVKQVEWMDPLLFYGAGKKIDVLERFYWSDPTQQMTLAGVGSAFTIANCSKDRFQNAQRIWEEVSQHILHTQTYEFGTGPLLFGGFTFDSQKKRTSLWEGFSDTVLWLPSFMLTVKDEKTWLTINQLVRKEDDVTQVYEAILQKEQLLLQGHKSDHEPVSWCKQEEVALPSWKQAIETVKEEMRQGVVDKVVLARELQLTAKTDVDSFSVVEALRIGQSDCYIYAMDYEGACFIGATPERLVRKEGDAFTSMCLAGSIGRGNTEEEDEENGAALWHDMKNRKEHAYVVHMIRTVMEMLCEEVDIPEIPGLMKTKHLIHLHTPVQATGTAKLLDVIAQLHPTPALGGTPREEALALIRTHEDLDRGFYGAPIGWVDYKGNGEFAVGLRSGLLRGEQVSLFAGCGIVVDSQVELEYEETRMKLKPMLTALGGTR